MLLATLLAGPEHLGGGDPSGPSFVHVFVLVWSGAAAVTINTILLGGSLSFFQCLCALGYCLLPLNMGKLFVCIICFFSIFWVSKERNFSLSVS